MLKSLGRDLPEGRHQGSTSSANPRDGPWENEPYFMGAFKANLPGHYRYQRPSSRTWCRRSCPGGQAGHLPRRRRHLLDGRLGRGRRPAPAERGLGRHAPLRRRGSDSTNPGPGDVYDEIAPVELPERTSRSRLDPVCPRLLVHLGGDVASALGVPCRALEVEEDLVQADLGVRARSSTIWSTSPWKGRRPEGSPGRLPVAGVYSQHRPDRAACGRAPALRSRSRRHRSRAGSAPEGAFGSSAVGVV